MAAEQAEKTASKYHQHTHIILLTCYQPVAYLNIQRSQSNISIDLESCFYPPDEFKSNI